MSRSVENLNNSSCDERDKESGAKEPRPSLASSSLTIRWHRNCGVSSSKVLNPKVGLKLWDFKLEI